MGLLLIFILLAVEDERSVNSLTSYSSVKRMLVYIMFPSNMLLFLWIFIWEGIYILDLLIRL